MEKITVGDAERSYFNGAIKQIETESSVLISSSKYLNNPMLRALIAQEMLRRNGADLPNTAYIPEVAGILHSLEDLDRIRELFEMEKQRLPQFKKWLDKKSLSNYTLEDTAHCAPGTLGGAIHHWMVSTGYQFDLFFQGLEVKDDLSYYLRQTSLTHDIEHMVTGFGPNHGGEQALIAANIHSRNRYFHPELSAFFSRISFYLKAKSLMKDMLYYPEALQVTIDAEFVGAQQGRNWKYPLLIVDWREYTDWQIDDIRKDLNITPIMGDEWDDTNRLCNECDPDYGQPMPQAAE